MKRVFKCDFCSNTSEDADEVWEHEKKCSLNPKNKYCFTCKHQFEAGYPISGHMPGCEINLDAMEAEKNGNCKGWEAEED